MRNSATRIILSAMLLAALALGVAVPAYAFDGRSGDNVTIAAGETISDDVYATGSNITVDGTIHGDLVAAGETITINGTVDGDVMAVGRAVIINGTVTDDVRLAGAALFLGEKAKIGGDVIGAAGSLEARDGSTLGNDVVFVGGQALVAGAVTRNVTFAGGGLELAGTVGGNVKAAVGSPESGGGQPMFYMPQTGISTPNVKAGLTLDPAAKIDGNLDYTTSQKMSIPAGIVAGKVTFVEAVRDQAPAVRQPSTAEKVAAGALDILRRIVTLLLFGLLLGWLFPAFTGMSTEALKTSPLPALGWGVVTIAATVFAIISVVVAMGIGAVLFGVLTLGSVAGTLVWLGLLAIFVLILGLVIAAAFLAPIIVATLGGQLILSRLSPSLTDQWVWPLVTGVIVLALLTAIPVIGGLIGLLVVLFGLGALWLVGRGRLTPKAAV